MYDCKPIVNINLNCLQFPGKEPVGIPLAPADFYALLLKGNDIYAKEYSVVFTRDLRVYLCAGQDYQANGSDLMIVSHPDLRQALEAALQPVV